MNEVIALPPPHTLINIDLMLLRLSFTPLVLSFLCFPFTTFSECYFHVLIGVEYL